MSSISNQSKTASHRQQCHNLQNRIDLLEKCCCHCISITWYKALDRRMTHVRSYESKTGSDALLTPNQNHQHQTGTFFVSPHSCTHSSQSCCVFVLDLLHLRSIVLHDDMIQHSSTPSARYPPTTLIPLSSLNDWKLKAFLVSKVKLSWHLCVKLYQKGTSVYTGMMSMCVSLTTSFIV